MKEDCLFYLLLFRTPASEKEEIFTYPDDDPFYSEFAAILHTIGATSVSDQVNQQNDVKENAASEDEASLAPTTTLSQLIWMRGKRTSLHGGSDMKARSQQKNR